MDSDSREVLMRTAERLFSEHGIAAVSLRMINRESGQKNHSAVHYHFGEKMGLLEAICEERAPALAAMHEKYLGPISGSEPGSVALEEIIEALLLPIADYLEVGGGYFIGLRHQMLLSTDPDVRLLVKVRDDREPIRQLREQIRSVVDHLEVSEVARRLHNVRLLNGSIIAELVAGEPDYALAARAFRSQIPSLIQQYSGLMRAAASERP